MDVTVLVLIHTLSWLKRTVGVSTYVQFVRHGLKIDWSGRDPLNVRHVAMRQTRWKIIKLPWGNEIMTCRNTIGLYYTVLTVHRRAGPVPWCGHGVWAQQCRWRSWLAIQSTAGRWRPTVPGPNRRLPTPVSDTAAQSGRLFQPLHNIWQRDKQIPFSTLRSVQWHTFWRRVSLSQAHFMTLSLSVLCLTDQVKASGTLTS